jgi:hypothetical protein
VLSGVLVDPRAEGIPRVWEQFLVAESVPGSWHSPVVRTLAWCSRSPSYLGLVSDRSGAPCAIFHLHHLGVGSWRHRFAADGLMDAGVIECRLGPASTGCGYRFASALDNGERRAAVSALERAVRVRLRWRVIGIAYRDVVPRDVAAFARRGRVCRRVTPEVIVENRWGELDEFFGDLPPKRRSELRRLDARLRSDRQLLIGNERSLDPAVASRLAASVARRHRRGLGHSVPIPASYFDVLGGLPGIEFLTYRDADRRLLSFATLLDDGAELADALWGNLDLSDGGRQDLYFHHYLRAIAALIARQRRRIALGKGLGELKLRYCGSYEDRFLVVAVS